MLVIFTVNWEGTNFTIVVQSCLNSSGWEMFFESWIWIKLIFVWVLDERSFTVAFGNIFKLWFGKINKQHLCPREEF